MMRMSSSTLPPLSTSTHNRNFNSIENFVEFVDEEKMVHKTFKLMDVLFHVTHIGIYLSEFFGFHCTLKVDTVSRHYLQMSGKNKNV